MVPRIKPKRKPRASRIAVVEARLDDHIVRTREKFAVIDLQLIELRRLAHKLPTHLSEIGKEITRKITEHIDTKADALTSQQLVLDRRIATLEEVSAKRSTTGEIL